VRTPAEVRRVQRLASAGLSQSQIARQTGIPRSTVRMWVAGQTPSTERLEEVDVDRLPQASYAYLLGLYLGDGCLTPYPRNVFKLRIALDSRYPGIIAGCVGAMRRVMPRSRTHVWKHPVHNVVNVTTYSKAWPTLFPQHGPGRKHERSILLDPFQIRLLDSEPALEQLLRGLVQSDGCRVLNRVNGGVYPRYMFDNRSDEIRAIFTGACEELGLRWTRTRRYTVTVSRRPDVARLDSFIGPKA
jgi:hypothetical protein